MKPALTPVLLASLLMTASAWAAKPIHCVENSPSDDLFSATFTSSDFSGAEAQVEIFVPGGNSGGELYQGNCEPVSTHDSDAPAKAPRYRCPVRTEQGRGYDVALYAPLSSKPRVILTPWAADDVAVKLSCRK
jgi:hypothetical protein